MSKDAPDHPRREYFVPPGSDDGYVDERKFLEAEQSPPGRASCTTLMSWLYRLVNPNRWPG
jgi:hypothetical protein